MHRFRLRYDGRGLQLTGEADLYGQDTPADAERVLRSAMALPADEGGVTIRLSQTMDESDAPDPRADAPHSPGCLEDPRHKFSCRPVEPLAAKPDIRNLAGKIMLKCGVRGMSTEHGQLQDWVEAQIREQLDAALKENLARVEEAKISAQNARTAERRYSEAANRVSKLEVEVARLRHGLIAEKAKR